MISSLVSDLVLSIKRFIISGCISVILWLDEPAPSNCLDSFAANTAQHPAD